MNTPPERTVVLHVGLMKSGTTWLQHQLFAAREELLAADVLLPGKSWGAQVTGVKGALKGGKVKKWERLAGQVREHDGRSVVSVELLGPAGRPQRDRVVESLRPARIEVVLTARDLGRSMVALWQETVQNGRSWTWPDYVDGVRTGKGEAARTFWRQLDLPQVVDGWREVADRVTVVTVPPPGAERRVLLDRFSRAAGLPTLEPRPVRANESLGLASLLVLRQVNEALEEADGKAAVARVRKRVLAKDLLARRRQEEPSLGFVVPDWLREQAQARIDTVRALDVDLVGDWADLEPVDVPGVGVDDVSTADQVEAAADAVAGLVERLARG